MPLQSRTRAGPARQAAKWLVRAALAPFLYHCGVLALLRLARRRLKGEAALLILVYHRVCDPRAPSFRYQSETLAVSPQRFAGQMAHLARHYRVLPLEAALRHMRDPAPRRGEIVAITFDDGYRDNFLVAHPVLARLGLGATIFLATDFIGTGRLAWFDRLAVLLDGLDVEALRQCLGAALPDAIAAGIAAYVAAPGHRRRVLINELCEAFKPLSNARKEAILAAMAASREAGEGDGAGGLMLDWDEARRMMRSGVEFGSHSCSHPILARVPAAALAHELAASKSAVERELGRPCTLFAYPNGRPGDWPEETAELLARSGYTAAFTSTPGVNGRGADPMALCRVAIGNYPPALFALVLEYRLWAGWGR